MSKHHIEVSSVALVDLKAEISRRQIEVKKNAQKLPEGCSVIKTNALGKTGEKQTIWRRQKPSHISTSKLTTPTSDYLEDNVELERSRRALEAKAKLYEALKAAALSGTSSYSKNRLTVQDDDVLVDFEQKAREESRLCRSPSPAPSVGSTSSPDERDECDDAYAAADSADEWVDYTDDRGVKRRCMRKDQEPPLRPDGPLTYAHLREGEIREHGVGFYAFSKDAEEREAEIARLRELHRATEEGRARAEAIRAKRDARMGQRLARLRARKGLPDVATAAAQCLAESAPPTPVPVSSDAQSDIRLSSEDLDVASMLRRLRDEAERRATLSNPVAAQPSRETSSNSEHPTNLADIVATNKIGDSSAREWDRGKSMMSAQRYIQAERGKRLPEFAPPSFY